MKKIEDILMMDEIRSLCQQALTDSEKCSIAMEQIYRQGFTDTPQLHEIEKQYVQRVFEIRRVQKQMYCDYIENPDAWRKEMLPEEPENQQVFSAGLGILVSQMCRSNWQREELERQFRRYISQTPSSIEGNLRFLQFYCENPPTGLIHKTDLSGIRPFLKDAVDSPDSTLLSEFADILSMLTAMSTYVVEKTHDRQSDPHLSFDSICIWSNAAVDVMLGISPINIASAVAGVLSCLYMYAPNADVLMKCMASIPILTSLIKNQIIRKIMKSLEFWIMPEHQKLTANLAAVLTQEPTQSLSETCAFYNLCTQMLSSITEKSSENNCNSATADITTDTDEDEFT